MKSSLDKAAQNRIYRAANREKFREIGRNDYARNKEKRIASSKQWRASEKATFTVMHLAARQRAKKHGLIYELSPAIIHVLCVSQGNKCALTGIPFDLEFSEEYRNRPFAPSIDRIHSNDGYTIDNVQITCVIVNKAKNEYTSEIFDIMCLARVARLKE